MIQTLAWVIMNFSMISYLLMINVCIIKWYWIVKEMVVYNPTIEKTLYQEGVTFSDLSLNPAIKITPKVLNYL